MYDVLYVLYNENKDISDIWTFMSNLLGLLPWWFMLLMMIKESCWSWRRYRWRAWVKSLARRLRNGFIVFFIRLFSPEIKLGLLYLINDILLLQFQNVNNGILYFHSLQCEFQLQAKSCLEFIIWVLNFAANDYDELLKGLKVLVYVAAAASVTRLISSIFGFIEISIIDSMELPYSVSPRFLFRLLAVSSWSIVF